MNKFWNWLDRILDAGRTERGYVRLTNAGGLEFSPPGYRWDDSDVTLRPHCTKCREFIVDKDIDTSVESTNLCVKCGGKHELDILH
jgi:hypothetical protein